MCFKYQFRNSKYISDSKAEISVMMGDARLSLEREEPQNFDLLIIDAFSSDSIPVHLITKEALEIYLRHLKSDGVIAFHISNKYLNLESVVARLAQSFNLQALYLMKKGDAEIDTNDNMWIFVSRNHVQLDDYTASLVTKGARNARLFESTPLWTDEYSNVWKIFKNSLW